MAKKIAVVTGSARPGSNSNAMADSFIKAAEAKGAEIVRIDATKLDIGVCHACDNCYKKTPCAFDDDFNKVIGDLESADGIVISCPVYWYTFPAKTKALLDKFYALCVAGRDFKGKKCALITCCEESGSDTLDGIIFSFDKTFQLLKADIVGKVAIEGVNEAGAIKNTDGEAKAAALAEKFI